MRGYRRSITGGGQKIRGFLRREPRIMKCDIYELTLLNDYLGGSGSFGINSLDNIETGGYSEGVAACGNSSVDHGDTVETVNGNLRGRSGVYND